MPRTDDIELTEFKQKLWKYNGEPGQVIPLLQEAQETYGFISPRIIHEISRFTGVAVSQIYGVATFYAQFRLTPVGEHIIRVCHGTACHVANANAISYAIEDELNIKSGETTPDKKFTLELVSCIGCCSLAPVIMVDDDTHGRLTPQKAREVLKQY
jgi:NADH-quinone oxidoreductase subunit E